MFLGNGKLWDGSTSESDVMAGSFVKLVLLGAVFTVVMQFVHLPGALLFGPLVAAVFFSNASIKIPAFISALSQALIGCLVARSFTPAIFANFSSHWVILLLIVTSTIAASCGIGWVCSKLRIFPGTTAVWGLLPGAATVMVLMSEQFDADIRLVAFMQYLRVICVGSVASLVGLVVVHTTPSGVHAVEWFAPVSPLLFAETIAIALFGVWVGPVSRLPAGAMLLPLILGGVLQCSDLVRLELPQWLLALAYTVVGWTIGLRFTKEVVAQAFKSLPQTLLAIFALILFSGALSWVLTKVLGIDPLTAYLSTSPGGMDTIAIIAASSKVDMPFVMTLQTMRFLMVLFVGPAASKFVVTHLLGTQPVTSKNLAEIEETKVLK